MDHISIRSNIYDNYHDQKDLLYKEIHQQKSI